MKKEIEDQGVKVFLANLTELTPNPKNARTHPVSQVQQIKASIREFGWTNPMLADMDDAGMIVAGHGRRLAAIELYDAGETIRLPNGRALPPWTVPAIDCAGWTAKQRRAYTLADNRLAETSEWDEELLSAELVFLREEKFDLGLTGFDDKFLDKLIDAAAGGDDPAAARATLAERFGIPPFSVLNAREGWWQDRKRAWIGLGIQSELGRGEGLNDAAPSGSARPSTTYSVDKARGDGKGRAANGKRKAATFGQDLMRGEHVVGDRDAIPKGLLYGEMQNFDGAGRQITGTSIFDPVVCELAYRWFCPPGGTILDPFAGGSVRGIVASVLGRQYVGCDLRAEQVDANRVQGRKICSDPRPVWITGDSRAIADHAAGTEADFVFSCPPYADLEIYSDDPADLSTLAYSEFRKAYFEIIAATCGMLKEDRFACFVVGEVRDKRGNYYGFVPDTIAAFDAAGLRFYNEAILVTAAGSLPIRAGKQFGATRKLGKTHQNILVFVKGDAKRATEAIGEVEFGEIVADENEGENA
jgi:ParB-like chromosome segregation protein Spo0J/DNA modification methylase